MTARTRRDRQHGSARDSDALRMYQRRSQPELRGAVCTPRTNLIKGRVAGTIASECRWCPNFGTASGSERSYLEARSSRRSLLLAVLKLGHHQPLAGLAHHQLQVSTEPYSKVLSCFLRREATRTTMQRVKETSNRRAAR